MTRDLPLPGAIPPSFAAALGTGIAGSQSTFLASVPASPPGFLGSGAAAAAFINGAPNSISVSDPLGNTGTTSSLTLLVGQLVGIPAIPAAVAFPAQRAGIVSAPPTIITITNPDTDNPATLGAGAITGANAVDFTLIAGTPVDCLAGATLGPGLACTFSVTFSEPTATAVNGAKSAQVSFPVTAPANMPPTLVNLTGTIDNIPPTVVSTIPANNGINVPANNALVATFSEPVTGVSNTTFTLIGPLVQSGPVTTVPGAVVIDPANKVATFTPTANLVSDNTYTATISTAVTDIAGNALAQNFAFSFITTIPNTDPPAVISTDPANNSIGARVSDPVTATFNTAVQISPLSINATTFFLSEGVTGSVTWDPVTRTASLKPDKPLDFFHKYTATVTTGVKSLGGTPMVANFTWSFLTNGAPSAPSLFLPADGATGVALPVEFQWVKSKDADGEPVSYHLWYCTNPGFLGCTPVDIASATTPTTTASTGSSLNNTLAGLGGYGAGILLAGFAIAGGVRSRRKIFFFIAVLAISVMAAAACGKKTETVSVPVGVDPATLITKSISTLKSGTTYYWKVVADDGNGSLIESETRSFTTL
jgi:hypothetical protein